MGWTNSSHTLLKLLKRRESGDPGSERRKFRAGYQKAGKNDRGRGHAVFAAYQRGGEVHYLCADLSGGTLCLHIPAEGIFSDAPGRAAGYCVKQNAGVTKTLLHLF